MIVIFVDSEIAHALFPFVLSFCKSLFRNPIYYYSHLRGPGDCKTFLSPLRGQVSFEADKLHKSETLL